MRRSLLSTKLMVMIFCLMMLLPVLNLDSSNSNKIFHDLSAHNPDGLLTIDLTSPPTLLTPSSGSLLADNTPNLGWSSVPGGIEYYIQVDNNADFSSTVVSQSTGSSTSFTCSTLSDNTYYW